MDLIVLLEVVLGLSGAGALLISVFFQMTTVSALAQQGSILERTATWASWSKKKVVDSATTATSAAAPEKTATTAAATSPEKHHHQQQQQAVATKIVDARNITPDREEKMVFTLSAINMMISAFIAASSPVYFAIWHSIKSPIYVFHRWWTFRKNKQHYLLFDFCYQALALTLIYLAASPFEWPSRNANKVMFNIIFMTANGPLAYAVLAFGQSLVLSSAPHMASVFVHTSPAILSFCIRWMGQPKEKRVLLNGTAMATVLDPNDVTSEPFVVCDTFPDCTDVSTFDLLLPGVMFHTGWMVVYYFVIYVVLDERVRSRGYSTLFDRVSKSGPLAPLLRKVDNLHVKRVVYLLTHSLFSLTVMSLATLYYRYKWLHFIFILSILTASAWNGATFFFTVFVEQRAEKARMLQEERNHHHHQQHHHHPNDQHQHHQVEDKKKHDDGGGGASAVATTTTRTTAASHPHNPLEDAKNK